MAMRWTVGTKIGAAFLLVMVIFVIVGGVSYSSTDALVTDADLRRQTLEVTRQLDAILIAVQDTQIAQRAFTVSRNEADLEPYRRAVTTIDTGVQQLRTLTQDARDDLPAIDTLDNQVREYLAIVAQSLDAARAGAAEPTDAVRQRRDTALRDIRNGIASFQRRKDTLLEERIVVADATANRTRWTILIGTLAALLLAGFAGVLITRNIAGPLQQLTVLAERITAGDLSAAPVPDGRRDEVGVLARTFARMTEALRTMAGGAEQIAGGDLRATFTPQSPADVLGHAFVRMSTTLRSQIGQLAEGTSVLGSAATQIVASTAQLASSAVQTASAVTETTTTVEEVRQTARLSSEKAKYVSDSAQKAAQISQNGRKSADDVTAGMARIRQQMDAIASSMGQLNEQSQAIGQIIATVEDLAVQSNLLAVNAAIEAAKAGEHGRGFAVVAQEVRTLAEQSRAATMQVRGILGDIQKAATAAVLATEQGSKAVDAGDRQAQVAGESIQALAGSVAESAQAATQIAASSQQQLVGVDQVASAMDSIREASTQNVASAKQLEAAARNLSELGQRLQRITEQYQV
jgi:methyl-accepting chemotaxis protein